MDQLGQESLLVLLGIATDVKANLVTFIPDFVTGVLILIIGIAVAYMVRWSSTLLVKWILQLLPRAISNKNIFKDYFQHLVLGTGRILFFLTIILTISTSLKRMGLLVVSEWIDSLSKYIPNVIGATLILFVGWKAREIVGELLHKFLRKSNFIYSLSIARSLAWSVFIISALAALEQIGVDMSLVKTVTTVVVGVAFAGITLTLALGSNSIIADILYCYHLNKYLAVGQLIEIKNVKGIVKAIGPTLVLVETTQGNVTIPGKIFNQEMTLLTDAKDHTDA